MIVRPATRTDHAASALVAYAQVAPPEPAGLERRTANWTTLFEEQVGSPHVAEADGEIVGILNFGPAREGDDVGELYVLYVHPDHWGSRAGQLLIEMAHAGLGRDFDQAVLSVLADNPRARRFYERNGWELEDVRVEPHFGGAPTEIARYRKRFDK